MEKNDLLSIGEIAARSGASVSAVRYYEQLGLLPAERTAGNRRVFPRHVLRRVALIQIAGKFDIPLSEVAEVFKTLPAHRPPSQADWVRISAAWDDRLRLREEELHRLRTELTGCLGCGCLSVGRCTLLNPGDRLGGRGPGARRVLEEPSPEFPAT